VFHCSFECNLLEFCMLYSSIPYLKFYSSSTDDSFLYLYCWISITVRRRLRYISFVPAVDYHCSRFAVANLFYSLKLGKWIHKLFWYGYFNARTCTMCSKFYMVFSLYSLYTCSVSRKKFSSVTLSAFSIFLMKVLSRQHWKLCMLICLHRYLVILVQKMQWYSCFWVQCLS